MGVLKETEAGNRLRTCAGGWDERGEFLSFEGGRTHVIVMRLKVLAVKSRRKGRGAGARGQPNLQ